MYREPVEVVIVAILSFDGTIKIIVSMCPLFTTSALVAPNIYGAAAEDVSRVQQQNPKRR